LENRIVASGPRCPRGNDAADAEDERRQREIGAEGELEKLRHLGVFGPLGE
jgi:hypothetical protein